MLAVFTLCGSPVGLPEQPRTAEPLEGLFRNQCYAYAWELDEGVRAANQWRDLSRGADVCHARTDRGTLVTCRRPDGAKTKCRVLEEAR